jgi:hypothetical protein
VTTDRHISPKPRRGLSGACFLILFLGFLIGCQRSAAPPSSPPDKNYGELPGLQKAQDHLLAAELRRIIAEKGTPEQLTQAALPKEQNGANRLITAFDTEELLPLLDETEKIFPGNIFSFDPDQLDTFSRFLEEHNDKREKIHEALAGPNCQFNFRFNRGLMADDQFIDSTRLAARLESMATAVALFKSSDVNEAIRFWKNQMLLADILDDEKLITARIQATRIREEALLGLQTILTNAPINKERLREIKEEISLRLEKWTPDRETWIGDRAMGLFLYEIIRDGKIVSVLTHPERIRLSQNGKLTKLIKADRRAINLDQWEYLKAMRMLIESSEKPFYQRSELGSKIENLFEAKYHQKDYPVIAAEMLMKNIDRAIQLLAQDRAIVEAWNFGLNAALETPDETSISSVTGGPFGLVRDPDRVFIWLDKDKTNRTDPDIMIPMPRKPENQDSSSEE